MKTTEIRVVSFDIANILIGSDRLRLLIRMGIVQCSRLANAGHTTCILLDYLP